MSTLTARIDQALRRANIGIAPDAATPVGSLLAADYRDRLLRGDQVLELPTVEWLVRKRYPTRSIGFLIGPPGAGKSFYANAFALELARDHGQWEGEKLKPATVLYIAAERPEALRDRQEAWRIHNNEPIPQRFLELPAAPQLTDRRQVDALCEIIIDNAPTLVIIDTLAAVTLGLDENSYREISKAIEALIQIRNCTEFGSVLVAHHTGKDTSRGMRGHSSLLGVADVVIELAGDEKAIRASYPKLNAADKPDPAWYRLEPVQIGVDDDGWPRGSAVILPTTARVAGDQQAGKVLTAVIEIGRVEGIASGKLADHLGLSAPTVRRALISLSDDGYVESRGKGPATRWYPTPKATS